VVVVYIFYLPKDKQMAEAVSLLVEDKGWGGADDSELIKAESPLVVILIYTKVSLIYNPPSPHAKGMDPNSPK